VSELLLDVKGAKCPIPVLKARKALRDVPAGGTMRVLATDPGAVKDFEHFCKTTGCRLVEWHDDAGVLSFTLEKPA
jgi:tRNA 2-thiouridine synthesizing protein A